MILEDIIMVSVGILVCTAVTIITAWWINNA